MRSSNSARHCADNEKHLHVHQQQLSTIVDNFVRELKLQTQLINDHDDISEIIATNSLQFNDHSSLFSRSLDKNPTRRGL